MVKMGEDSVTERKTAEIDAADLYPTFSNLW